VLDRELAAKWLGHLKHDSKGRAVPYINMWGPLDIEALYLGTDPHTQREAVFYLDRGDEPNFKRQSVQRQRECMIKGLCQVCGRPVPWPDRLLVISSMSTSTVSIGGATVPVVTEPWLDATCAYIAMNWCPELIRAQRGDELTLAHVTGPEQCSMLLATEWVEGPLAAYTKANPAVSFVKLALLLGDMEQVLSTLPVLNTPE
jgi:hypothetical protein